MRCRSQPAALASGQDPSLTQRVEIITITWAAKRLLGSTCRQARRQLLQARLLQAWRQDDEQLRRTWPSAIRPLRLLVRWGERRPAIQDVRPASIDVPN